jgi:hypothetical protein
LREPNQRAAASDWEREYYGSHCERLRQVKTAYDPDNVFNFEQSVPVSPAGPRSCDRSGASSGDARMLLDADERLR